MKQTAVHFLVDKVAKDQLYRDTPFNEWLKIFEQALAMENEQTTLYHELVYALKETHNLYVTAVKSNYATHDITRIMGNEHLFRQLDANTKTTTETI